MSRQPLGGKQDNQADADPSARPGNWLLGPAKGLQSSLRSAGPVAAASYSLIGAIVLLGGAGYFADGWFGTSPWLLIIGLLLGIVVGFYELIRVVWRRTL
jgi:ATP synthase protein I